MLRGGGVFNEILEFFQFNSSSLIQSLNKISHFYGSSINWDLIRSDQVNSDSLRRFQDQLGIIFYPIPSNADLACSIYPLLVQLPNGHFETRMVNNCCKFNGQEIRVWQCMPVVGDLPSSLRELWSFFITRFGRGVVKYFCVLGFLSSMILFLNILTAYSLSNVFHLSTMSVQFYMACLLLISAIAIITYLSEHSLVLLITKARLMILPSSWYQFLNMNLLLIKKQNSASWVQILMGYDTAVMNILSNQCRFLSFLIASIFLMMYLLYTQVVIGLIFLSFSVCYLCIKIFFQRKNILFISAYLKSYPDSTLYLQESLGQIDKIRSANIERKVREKWIYKVLKARLHLERSNRVDIFLALIDALSPPVSLLLLCLYWVLSKDLPAQAIISYLLITTQLFFYINRVSSSISAMLQHLPALKAISLLDYKQPMPIILSNSYDQFHLQVEDVTFKINSNPILENVSFELYQGEFIGLIGRSGAGKSSLLRILLGLENDYTGKISINGVALDATQKLDRTKVGVVLQTSRLFPGSIFSNIATNTGLTLDDVWLLAEQVGLDKSIRAMPMKMFTHISDNPGESLSGGQRQKILIARALANKPQLLVLDEPSSALDNASQAAIFKHLRLLKLTMIVVAHRQSTLKQADRLYRLDNGKLSVIENSELMDEKGSI